MRKTLLLIIVIGIFTNLVALTILSTTTDSLNVRNSPGGKIIDKLPMHSMVGLIIVKGTWAKVMYSKKVNSNNFKQGWVSVKYLKIKKRDNEDCDTDFNTNAEACVVVKSTDIDCSKSYEGNYYSECNVEVDYEVNTTYKGNDYIDIDVTCEVNIDYKKADGYSSSESEDEKYSHSLIADDYERKTMDFDFDFSYYEKPISVQLDSVECKISDVYTY